MTPKKMVTVCSFALGTGMKNIALTVYGPTVAQDTIFLNGPESPEGTVVGIRGPNEMVVSFDALDILAYLGANDLINEGARLS